MSAGEICSKEACANESRLSLLLLAGFFGFGLLLLLLLLLLLSPFEDACFGLSSSGKMKVSFANAANSLWSWSSKLSPP